MERKRIKNIKIGPIVAFGEKKMMDNKSHSRRSARSVNSLYSGSSEFSLGVSSRRHSGISGVDDPQATMEAEKKFVENLSKRETRKVQIWRRNVLIVLVVTGALLATATYFYLINQDTDDFDSSVSTIYCSKKNCFALGVS